MLPFEERNVEIYMYTMNPIIENETGLPWPFSEGCLSIPGIREDVERKAVIKISYYDENWNFFEESYQGIAARIIQHEYDHIEGILFTDHLNPLKKRLMKRAEVSGRADDADPKIIENRIAVYKNETAPVKSYYDDQNKFIGIDGMGSVNDITERLYAAIDAN